MLSTRETILSLEAIEQLRSSLSVRGKSDKTIKAYVTDLRIFLTDLKRETVTQEEFEELGMIWLQSHREALAPKTTSRRLTSLRAWGRFAGYPATIFDDYTPPVAAKGMPHPLPEGMDGVRRLLGVSRNENQQALIALCGMLGLRVSEALATKPEHFDLQRMLLTVRGKGDKTRIVPISQEAWSWLVNPVTRAFIAGGVPVVGFRDRFARRTVTNLGMRARLERTISSHDLRATFATSVYNKTLDQRAVQELMGHANGAQTELYIEVALGTLKAAVEDL